MIKKLSFSIFIIVSSTQVQAQSLQASQNASLHVNNVIEVSFHTGGSGISMAFSTADQFQNGIESIGEVEIRVKSNRPYNVVVKTATSNFTSNTATTMPVSGILSIKPEGSSTYMGLTNADQNLLVNKPRGNTKYDIAYKAVPGFNYEDGTYSVSIVYTATQL